MKRFLFVLCLFTFAVLLVVSGFVFLGCGEYDDTPAQFVKAERFKGSIWEVRFDKTPEDVVIEGAREYRLSGKKLVIWQRCKEKYGHITIWWRGGKKQLRCWLGRSSPPLKPYPSK